jgi:hypothetical protein
MESNKAVRTI